MIHVVQAFDRQPLAQLPQEDAQDLERKLLAAHQLAGDRRSRIPTHVRIDVLRRVARSLDSRRDHFAHLIAREGGKPLTDAYVEVERAVDGIRTAVEILRVSGGREVPMGLTAASSDRRAFTFREPIGVVAAISAFNHPLNLIVHQVIPAIAVGCPVIVKPAQTTPLCCLELVALIHEAGLPPGWCQSFLPDSVELSEALAKDPRVAFLSFIGSARVGWLLRSKLAPGTRCALEHGGTAPTIIDRSADLDRVIEPLVKGSYYHAGQVCVSTQRIYVHDTIFSEFLDRFSARAGGLRVGDPVLPETEVGPLITPREADRVAQWIGEAVAGGAVLIGGERLSETTIRPAIMVEPDPTAKVSRLEVFGPVTCLFKFSQLDEAIAAANLSPYSFQASVFTESLSTALEAVDKLNASAVMVNDHTAFRTDWMPFSGRRESGYGVGGIPGTMHDMTEDKMVVFKT